MSLDEAIAQYTAKTRNIHSGSALQFGQPGQYVSVKIGNKTLRCRAGSVINSTQVAVLIADNGEAFAFCESAPRVTRSTVSRWVKSRPGGVEAIGNIKYVLQKTVVGVTSLWVCGWQDQCQKVLDLPNGASLGQAVIDNPGGEDYFVTLYYILAGQYIFQFYDQNGLVNQYSETGLNAYQEIPGNLTLWNPFVAFSGLWDNTLCAVGYGRFICNYGEDSSTVLTPFTGGTVSPGDTRSASKSGRIRFVIDLQSNNPIQKYTHSTESVIRNVISTSVTVEDWTDKWLGLTVNASLPNTVASQLDIYSRIQALPIGTIDSNTRLVYRASQAGDVAIGELLRQIGTVSPGSYTPGSGDGFYIYVNDTLNDNLYFVRTWINSASATTNRFLLSLSQGASSGGTGRQFIDVTGAGLNYIENAAASPTATPAPIPSTTLYRIERSRNTTQVTVQQLGFDFTVQGSVDVDVYPPDINQSETSNYGAVLCASYGEAEV